MPAIYRLTYTRATKTEEIKYVTIPADKVFSPESMRPAFYVPISHARQGWNGPITEARYYLQFNPSIRLTARLVTIDQRKEVTEYHDGYTTHEVTPMPQPIEAQEGSL